MQGESESQGLHGEAGLRRSVVAPAPELRILVVDDEQDVREAVGALLEAFLDHPRIRLASSGSEALRVLRNEGADLILTDFKMPGMNGAQFLSEARRVAPGTRHILLTAFDREALQSLDPKVGTPPIVHKPFEPDHLLEVVDDVMGAA